jgi:hypothetical protein
MSIKRLGKTEEAGGLNFNKERLRALEIAYLTKLVPNNS